MGSCSSSSKKSAKVSEPVLHVNNEAVNELLQLHSGKHSSATEKLINDPAVTISEKVQMLKSSHSIYLSKQSEPITSLAYSSDFKTLVSSSKDKSLKFWDIQSLKQTKEKLIGSTINQVVLSSDNLFLFTLTMNSKVSQYDYSSLELIKDFPIEGYSIASISISPNNDLLFIGGGSLLGQNTCPIRVFKIKSSSENGNYFGHRSAANSMVFTIDQKFMVSCSGGQFEAVTDNSVRLWKLGTQENLKIYDKFSDFVTSVVVGSRRKIVIAGCNDRSIHYLDFDLAKIEIFRRHDLAVKALALSSDELLLVSAGQDSTVRVWDLVTKWQKYQFTIASVNCLVLIGSLIVSGANSSLKAIEMESQSESDFPGHTGEIDFLYVQPDSNYLVSGTSKKVGSDSALRIWNLETGIQEKSIHYPIGLKSLSIDKDGRGLIIHNSNDTTKVLTVRGKIPKEVKHSDGFNLVLMNRKKINIR